MTPAGPRRGWLIVAGVVVAAVGLASGAVLWLAGAAREEQLVRDLARAPAGCVTALEFERTGSFYVYVETRGVIGDLSGSCDRDDRTYDLDAAPPVEVELADPDGRAVELEPASGIGYDVGGFAGEVRWSLQIEEEGTYRLVVRSDDPDAVVALGGDVSDVGRGLSWAALGTVAFAAVIGVVLVLVGLRRRPAPPEPGPLPPPRPLPPPTWGSGPR